ncbi:MAG: hypothetical protein V4550_12770 [Gemmatimonadota bacterium]
MHIRRLTIFLALAVGCSVAQISDVPVVPVTSSNPVTMAVLGRGDYKPARYTGEVFVRGTTAYTTTWGNAGPSSAIYIWDVSGNTPAVVDSVIVDNATTLGDVAVSDDGSLLVVATERASGAIVLYSLANPRKPVFVSRFQNNNTTLGVHTAEIGQVNGKLYGFLCIDPGSGVGARIVIVDLSVPASPQQVYTQTIGTPYVHDTFVRDGLLFLGLWNDGVAIWDIGGGALGGSVSAPKEVGRVKTLNGEVHNVWWLKDPVTGNTKYAFIGEEGPGSIGASSVGDVHVVDVSTMSAPREVAFYTVAGAGTHNFSVDEQNGILYAAYYNGGVRALDVRGDLGTCTDAQKSQPANSTVPMCDLRKMGRELGIGLLDRGNPVYVWGVQYVNGAVYASDMINGIWKLRATARP